MKIFSIRKIRFLSIVFCTLIACGDGNGSATTNSTSDTVSPTVTVTSPSEGASVLGITSIQGTASDNVALSKVEVQIDNGPIELATGVDSWSFSLDTRSLSNGTHRLTIQVTDTSLNITRTSIDIIVINPINCEDTSGLLSTINIPPDTPPPPPSLVTQSVDGRGVTLFTYEHVTNTWQDSPGFANRTRKFAVTVPPGYNPSKNYPLMIWLHGGCGDYFSHTTDLKEAMSVIVLHPGDPNTQYENVNQRCIVGGKITHYGYMSNFVPSVDSATGLERTSGSFTTDALFVDYTQRRYLYYLDFVQTAFSVDPNRVFVRGHSKGGGGTVYTTLFNQDRIAGGLSDVLRPNIAPIQNQGTSTCTNYGYNMLEYSDIAWWIQNNPDQLNFWIQTDHGKDDQSARFHWFNYPSASSPLSFFDTLEQHKVGHYTIWDEGGHEKNNGTVETSNRMDPVLGYHWWDGGWDIINDPTTYLALNKSFPAFSNFSLNQDYGVGPPEDDCKKSIDPVYGTVLCAGDVAAPGDNQHNGEISGVLNRYLRWNTNTIVDTEEIYSIEIKILHDANTSPIGGTCGNVNPPSALTYPPCFDNYTGNGTETVDVTPRRLQNFKINPGELIKWQSSSGQSGTVTSDFYGVVTIPAFEVFTQWRTLTLRR